MTAATSDTEASVFVGWQNSPIYFVGKYLYTKPGDKEVSEIVVSVDDPQNSTPCTH